MRIISGKHRGRRLIAPKNLPVRPTTDFAKEGLFNVLNNLIYFEEIEVLDLFAGTGSISFEFMSRGAKRITCVDESFNCIKFIKSMCTQMNVESIDAIPKDVFKYLMRATSSYDLIFADPPYEIENIEEIHKIVFKNNLLKEDGLLIIEHSESRNLTRLEHFSQKRNYGKVNFSFFTKTIT